MLLGYYFAVSTYGSYLQQVKPYTSFTFCEAGWTTDWGYHGSQARFVTHMKRAARLGFKIHLNFQWAPGVDSKFDATCALAAPYWDAVDLVDLRDEPAGSIGPAVNALRDAIDNADLPRRPVGAVFNQQEMLSGRARMIALDWVGIEAYVDPDYQATGAGAVAEMQRVTRAQLDLIPPGKKIVVVGQAYDRNGKWTNIKSLAALQIPTWQEVKCDPRVTHLRWFSYARRGGTLAHPSLIPKHKAIAEMAGAAP